MQRDIVSCDRVPAENGCHSCEQRNLCCGVRTASVMYDKIIPGDYIVAIDGKDVSHKSIPEIRNIMPRKSHHLTGNDDKRKDGLR